MRSDDLRHVRRPAYGRAPGRRGPATDAVRGRRSRLGQPRTAGLVAACAAWLMGAPAVPASLDLQRRIQQAAPHDTVPVPAGRYTGRFVIDRPLTLSADGPVVLDGAGEGDVIRIAAPEVTIRGFVIRGTGNSLDQENAGIVALQPRARIEDNVFEDVLFGVYLRNADSSILRRNTIGSKPVDVARRGDAIRLWHSPRCRIEGNVVRGSRDVVIWFSEGVELVGNTVRDCRYGVHFMYSRGGRAEGNTLVDNSVGAFLMYSRDLRVFGNVLARNRGPSGYGLGLKDMDGVDARNNLIAGNRIGIYLDNSPESVNVYDHIRGNVLAYNDIALAFQPSVQRNRFSDNAFVENTEQIAVLGGGELRGNEFTVAGRGNYWSNYAGYDADGDGRGDLPYRSLSLFENLMDRHPLLRLFLYSPAQQAIDTAARAFPIMQPVPKVVDEAPLMRPPAIQVAGPALPDRGAMLSVGLCLLGGAGLTMVAARGPWAGRGYPSAAASAPAASAREEADTPALPVLEVRGLTKRFGRTVAVDGLSFCVTAGEALALWGPNGAGKTTAIKCILGLYRCAADVVLEGCVRARGSKVLRRRAGYVSQELAFYDDLSARQTTQLFAHLRRLPSRRAEAVLEEVELAEHAEKPVRALSGGMKQRLALAVALLSDPPLLVLDEPTSNLDAAARQAFVALLIRLKQRGKTIVFSTHRYDEVLQLADRVLVMERGRAIRSCPAAELASVAGLRSVLRIPVPGALRNAACRVLEEAGFAATGNGKAVLVRVTSDRKAAPIRVLSRAGIEVEDFEVETEMDHESPT